MNSKFSFRRLLSWHIWAIIVLIAGAIFLQEKIGTFPTLLLLLVLACPIAVLFFWGETKDGK